MKKMSKLAVAVTSICKSIIQAMCVGAGFILYVLISAKRREMVMRRLKVQFRASQLLFYPSFRLSVFNKRFEIIDRLVDLQQDQDARTISLSKVAKYLEKVNLMLERLKSHNQTLDVGVSRVVEKLVVLESNCILI